MTVKENDILVVGELNIDLILGQIAQFPKIGAEILAKEMTFTMGSSSAIFACNARALGARVAFSGLVGDDEFGRYMLRSLSERHVNTKYVQVTPQYKTGATVALNFDQDRAMVTHPGAMEYLELKHIDNMAFELSQHLHISSIFLQPLVRRDLIEILKKARAAGLTTSLDTQWDPSEKWDLDLEKILPLVDIFLPNEAELLALTKCTEISTALKKLGAFANIVVVKRGQNGSDAFYQGKKWHSDPFFNEGFIDAIGAGDSFDAGFVVKYLRTRDIEQSMRYGNLAGAINTTAAGGTEAFRDRDKLLRTAREKFRFELEGI